MTPRSPEWNQPPANDSRVAVQGILGNLSDYSDQWQRLPAATVTDGEGRPLCSWRFATAAFLLGDPVQCGYYGQAAHCDKPWNSPENRRYLSGPHRVYAGSPASYLDDMTGQEPAKIPGSFQLECIKFLITPNWPTDELGEQFSALAAVWQ